MTRVILRASCCVAAVAALAAIVPGEAAAQRSPTAGVAGSWNGFYQDAANPADQGLAAVQVSGHPGSPLTATVDLKNFAFVLEGRVSERRALHLAGSVAGASITIDGRDQSFGGGSLADLQYVLAPPRSAVEHGLLLVIRDFADPAAPDVSGSWRGTYSSGFDRSTGDVVLELTRPTGSASRATGRLTFRGQPSFACEGTIRSDGRLLLVGIGPAGRFFAEGRADVRAPTGQASLHAVADYHLQFFDRSIDFGRFDLTLGTVPR